MRLPMSRSLILPRSRRSGCSSRRVDRWRSAGTWRRLACGESNRRLAGQPSPLCALSLRYLLSFSEFTDSPDQPLLEGERFPQAPVHRLVAGVESSPLEWLDLFAQVDAESSRYDDALGRRRLEPWWTARLGARVMLPGDVSLSARLENLFDEEIPTGLSSSGLQSVGIPRSFWIDLRWIY